MANHKWDRNICRVCGLTRDLIKSTDLKENDYQVYQYSIDGKNWFVKRKDCYTPVINNSINEKASKDNYKNQKEVYSALLKKPQWQKKRLEIMQRDEWKCKCCKDDSNELHVHHLAYTAKFPWDEISNNLITLCSSCHEALHYLLANDTYGIETFISLCRMLNDIEISDINK